MTWELVAQVSVLGAALVCTFLLGMAGVALILKHIDIK